jgi:hypothetical protein
MAVLLPAGEDTSARQCYVLILYGDRVHSMWCRIGIS